MPSIVTITFNPCIDKSTTVASLAPETKLRCALPVFEPGGGGINVARAIKKLGGNAHAIYPAGGYSGAFLNTLLQKEKIETTVIETTTHTRENLIVLDAASKKQYRFGMPGATLAQSEWQQCLHAVEQLNGVQYLIASGSLPPGVPPQVFAQVARLAKEKGAKCIVDTSGEALKLALDEGVYLAKPNLKELSALVEREVVTADDVYQSVNEIVASKKAHALVVSLGDAGAMLATKYEYFQILPPAVEVKSTVGAGDSMVAGIVLQLTQGHHLNKAVQYGVACGTAATLNPGTELCRQSDVDDLHVKTKCNLLLSVLSKL